MKKFNNKIYYLLIGGLFGLCCFLMLYKLGDIPNGIHVDEAGAIYDAKSLIKYGVDRYLYHNPVYFINFGGGQNALYTYLATFTFRIFGISLWSFRMVSVIVNLISYYCFFKLVRRYKSKLFSIFILFLLTILPVYVMKARWGLESFLMNPMIIISLYFYVSAIVKKSNLFYVVAGILFGISFYTYAISYLVIPIFLVVSIIYLLTNKYITTSNIFALLIPVVLLGIPLLLMLLINKGIIENEIITSFISIPKLWFYRGGEISISNIKYIIDDLESIFFGNWLIYNSIPKFGTVYMISIPFIVFGVIILIYRIIKKKYDLLDFFMLIMFIVIFLVCLCIDDLNVNKANAIYICLVYFIVIFLEWLFNKGYRKYLMIILILYCFNFIVFISYYFKDYSVEYREMPFFETISLFEALDYSESICGDGDTIYVGINQGYIYTLLNFDVNPYDYNEKALFLKDMEVVSEFDNYKYYIGNIYNYHYDYIYVVKYNDNLIDYLSDRGFSKKEFDNYYVLYYDEID